MKPFVKSLLHAAGFVALLVALYFVCGYLDTPARTGGLLGGYGHELLLDIGIAITLAVSLNLILGMAGQFSLGHAGFAAAGAFTSILIAGRYFAPLLAFLTQGPLHMSVPGGFQGIMWMGALAGAAVAALLGLLVGLPTLRLRGDYLAIATLGFGEIMAVFLQNFTLGGTAYFGGSTGLSLTGMRGEWISNQPDTPVSAASGALADAVSKFQDDVTYYVGAFPIFALALVTIYIVHNIKYATSGRALLALREDAIASESVGVPTTRYKVAAFVIGAALAGLAGGLFAHHKSLINPEGFRFMRSIEIVAMVILGGQGSISGSVLAAIILTSIPEELRTHVKPFLVSSVSWLHLKTVADWVDGLDIEKWRMVIYSLFIILTMLFRPTGLFGRYEIHEMAALDWRRWRGLRLNLGVGFAAAAGGFLLLFVGGGWLFHWSFSAWLWAVLVCATVPHYGLRLTDFLARRWGGVSRQRDLAVPAGSAAAAEFQVTPGVATLTAEPVRDPDKTPVPLLDAQKVTMQFGGLKAVDEFTLAIYPGELIGLIGPNGAGKTTVFNALTGVYRPTRGDIVVVGRTIVDRLSVFKLVTAALVVAPLALGGLAGLLAACFWFQSVSLGLLSVPVGAIGVWMMRPLWTHRERTVGLKPHAIARLGVARTFQNIRLFANLSVIDNVQIAQHAHHKQGIPAAIFRTPAFFREEETSRRRALGYLDLFNLAHLAREQAGSLSYGDQRRLEIARALATRPRILLLDEPAAGMNPTEKRELMELIRSLRPRFGLTVLLIEHDMKVIMGVCQRILVLDYGKTIAQGTPAEIRRNPAVIQAYLGKAAKQE